SEARSQNRKDSERLASGLQNSSFWLSGGALLRLILLLDLLGSRALPLFKYQLVAVGCDLAQPAQRAPGAGRNEPTDDHVLLEALKRIGLAVNRSVGEDTCGLLERRRRDEGAGLQARLGDAEQHRLTGGGLAAGSLDGRVDILEVDTVHLLALEELGRAGIVHLRLLQHLPDDHLDMLVVDGHALQTVDLLDLVDEIVGELFDSLDRKDV